MRTNVDIKKSRSTKDKGLATMRRAPKLRPEGRREGGKEGRREGGKEGRREGGKEGRREGGKEGRREVALF
ncbi:hypothetical protein [Alcaligenes sp. SJTW-7]|uniref:hypothetical protein n=1 Tax=Alcaligenes sp. SJTW-7 TaxID=3078429 RepID=UPI0039E9DCEC